MIQDRKEELLRLYDEHAPKDEATRTNGHRPTDVRMSDEEIIGLCRKAKNAPKFERLFDRGDATEYRNDDSSADLALLGILGFYTQDHAQLDDLFRRSALCRPKWTDRADYRRRSISRALAGLTETYALASGIEASKVSTIYSAALKEEVPAERIIAFRTAREVAALTPAKTEWIVAPFVAKGAITELDGKIKAGGKTTFVSHMVKSVVAGSPFMGEPTRRTRVLLLTEQSPTSFRKVLERAGLTDCEDLLVLFWHDVAALPWPEVAALAADKALEVGAELLITDTLGQFAGIRGDGENSAGAAQEAMGPLQEAAARGLGVLLTRHERKGGGEVGESARGSSAFGGAVDVILSIRRGDGNTRLTVRVIESLSRFDETPDKLVVELTPNGYRSLGDVTAFAEEEAAQAIRETLPATPDNAMTTGELTDKLKEQDVKRTSSQAALSKLLQAGTVTRIGGGKKGDPFRHFLSAETPAPSGRKQTQGTAVPKEAPARDEQIRSAGTSTLYAAERKLEREEVVL